MHSLEELSIGSRSDQPAMKREEPDQLRHEASAPRDEADQRRAMKPISAAMKRSAPR
jgi:hypothetical protein